MSVTSNTESVTGVTASINQHTRCNIATNRNLLKVVRMLVRTVCTEVQHRDHTVLWYSGPLAAGVILKQTKCKRLKWKKCDAHLDAIIQMTDPFSVRILMKGAKGEFYIATVVPQICSSAVATNSVQV